MSRVNRKTNSALIKVLRIIIYAVSVVGATIGACLVKTGGLSSPIANGTSKIKISIGEPLFVVCIIIFACNLFWGIIRFALRGSSEHWSLSRTIFKTIGSLISRALIFGAIFLLSAFLIYPHISDLIEANVNSGFEPISLSQNLDRLEYINDNFDTLNYDDYKDELSGLLYNNIDFGTDVSGNISTKSPSLLFENVSAYTPKVTTLNKAKLSSAGHFVVFYTDTGDDRISDDTASYLAEMLETIIKNYDTNLGLKYEYHTSINNRSSISKMQAVLENSGIDRDIIDIAMPVYVASPYKNGSSTLASYAGTRFKGIGLSILVKLGSLLGEENAAFYNSAPSYPFINITPGSGDSDSFAIVTAHELGHHYIETYNENNFGKNGSMDDFTDETTPNWMAINVLPNEPPENIINANHYNKAYLKSSTNDTISKASSKYNFTGYPSLAFLQNYYEIVPNAKNLIMEATFYGDALNYLYNHAGADQFKKVMVALAEKNLTGDYGGKLNNTELPKGLQFSCADVCARDYSIDAASTRYLYFATQEYQNSVISFRPWKSVGESYFSVVGENSNGDWEVITSALTEGEYEIDESVQSRYATIAIAVANSSVTDTGYFNIKISKTKIKEIIVDEGDFDFSRYGNFFTEKGSGCYDIDTNELFSELTDMITAGENFLQLITNLQKVANPDIDYSDTESEFQRGANAAREALEDSKAELSPYEVVVCANHIKSDSEFDSTKTKIKNALDGTLNVYNVSTEGDDLSVFASFNPLTQNAKIYFLARTNGNMGLITINLLEK